MIDSNMVEKHWLTIRYALTRSEIFESFVRSVALSPKYRGIILLYSAAIGLIALLVRATLSRSLTWHDAVSALAYAVGYLVFISLWVFIRGKTAERTLTV